MKVRLVKSDQTEKHLGYYLPEMRKVGEVFEVTGSDGEYTNGSYIYHEDDLQFIGECFCEKLIKLITKLCNKKGKL